MPGKSLNRIAGVRRILQLIRHFYFTRVWGMDIHPTAKMSMSARLDKTNPAGVHVGAYSYIAFHATVLSHDMVRHVYVDTRIGENCFIGAHSIILPGITVGNGSIVGTGSVVTKDVPANTIVAGNPARVIRESIATGTYGRL